VHSEGGPAFTRATVAQNSPLLVGLDATDKYDGCGTATVTRTYAPASPPVALAVAGSDSGGGAGIQADLRTMAAHGVHGTSVVTATTAQHTRGVEDTHVLPVDHVRAQYRAVAGDVDLGAVKTGMLATAPVVGAVRDCLADAAVPVVVDPVMVAASGDRLLSEAAEAAYEELLAEARLATPNVDEAEVLAGQAVSTPADAVEAGETIRETGVDAVLVKGGHLSGETVVDTLVTADGVERFEHPRVDTDATHGSGCVLSSAVAARLASGEELTAAVGAATAFLARAVRYGADVGEGPGAVDPLVDVRDDAAREPTAEAVTALADRLLDADVGALVPDTGLSVVGATPRAETRDDAAAVDGRVVRTRDGPRRVGAARFGADDDVAAALLDAREADPSLRFGAAVRRNAAVALAGDEVPGVRSRGLDDGRLCLFGPTPDAVASALLAGEPTAGE
jgi:hydroxymethylpyrimidine kinase/phosphomethylpyrimidine kinase